MGEEEKVFSLKNDFKKLLDHIIHMFYSPTVNEQKKEYIKKYGYPEKTVIFVDSQGRGGSITGKEIYRKIINHPTSKRISKEIKEQGHSCPENW